MKHAIRTGALVALLGVFAGTAGCDFFTELYGNPEEITQIRIPIPIDVPQALPIQLPPQQVIDAAPTEADGSRVLETCGANENPSSGDACLLPIYISDLDLIALDTSGQLEQYQDVIEGIEIASVTATVSNNSLTVSVQPIELRVGAPGADYAGATTAAATPVFGPGFTGTEPGTIDEGNREAVGAILGGFQFGIGMGTSVFIPADAQASGQADVQLSMVIEVIVNPL